MVYMREQNRPGRFAELLPAMRADAVEINDKILTAARVSDGRRLARFVTDAACEIVVAAAVVPDQSNSDFGDLVQALEQLGYDNNERKYLVYADLTFTARPACGMSNNFHDDRSDASNRNNGRTYAFSFAATMSGGSPSKCWFGTILGPVFHELIHAL